MASDGNAGQIPAFSFVQGSQTARPSSSQPPSGNSLPPSGTTAAYIAAPAPTSPSATSNGPSSGGGSTSAGSQAAGFINPAAIGKPAASAVDLVDQLNKYLNNSGRPDQFRIDPSSGGKLIQQVNPASGEVIGEFSASEFPALARSVGPSGLLFDGLV